MIKGYKGTLFIQLKSSFKNTKNQWGVAYLYLKKYCNALFDFKKALLINNNLPSIKSSLKIAEQKCERVN